MAKPGSGDGLGRVFREDLSAEVTEVVVRLASIFRNAHVHNPNNATWVPLVNALTRALVRILQVHGSVLLEVGYGRLALNGSPIRLAAAEQGAGRYLGEVLGGLRIGGLRFDRRPGPNELKGLAYVVAGTPGGEPLFAIETALRAAGVHSIAVVELPAENDVAGVLVDDATQAALALFVQGIDAVREVYQAVRQRHGVGFRRVKRFVQEAADLLDTDPRRALALTTIKNYGGYLPNHAVNGCFLSLAVGRRLRMRRRQLGDLALAVLLRDVGRAVAPDAILDKPAALSDREWGYLQRFPYDAVTALLRFRGFSERSLRQVLVAFEHPFRRAQRPVGPHRALNLYSKIAHLVSAFDAMATPRPYRERPLTPEQALRELTRDELGHRMDPVLLKVLIQTVGLYPVGSLVLMDTGELAVVAAPHRDERMADRPLVAVIAAASGLPLKPPRLADTAQIDSSGHYTRTIHATIDAWENGLDVATALLSAS